MVLFINACISKKSRTERIAKKLLKKLGDYTEVKLEKKKCKSLNRERLEEREKLVKTGVFDDPIFQFAHQFAAADTIVIAAPYWDMAFPAKLKNYIENICVVGLTFKYDENDRPVGLCRAKKLYYVTTAGGPFMPEFGYGYIQALAKNFFGIQDTELIYAEMLDIAGNDPEKILQETLKKYGLSDKG